MQLPGSDLVELMKLATTRGQRLGSSTEPAVWYFPANRSKAQTLLFVHGFRGDHHGLMAIAGALPEFNVLIPDLPGYGKSALLPDGHTVENYAIWLLKYCKQLAAEFSPVHLVAHSFGTQVVSVALELGLKPKSVSLLNPISEKADAAHSSAKRMMAFAYNLASKLGALGSAMLRSWIGVQAMSSSLARTRDKVLRHEIHRQHHKFFSNYLADSVIIDGFNSARANLVTSESLPLHTLIVAGENDIVAPLKSQLQLVSGREDLDLVVLPGAGHLVHYENPRDVADLIREHVLRSSGRKSRLVAG